jgi:hypothetical protein
MLHVLDCLIISRTHASQVIWFLLSFFLPLCSCLVTMAGLRSVLLGRLSLRRLLKLPRLLQQECDSRRFALVYPILLLGTWIPGVCGITVPCPNLPILLNIVMHGIMSLVSHLRQYLIGNVSLSQCLNAWFLNYVNVPCYCVVVLSFPLWCCVVLSSALFISVCFTSGGIWWRGNLYRAFDYARFEWASIASASALRSSPFNLCACPSKLV